MKSSVFIALVFSGALGFCQLVSAQTNAETPTLQLDVDKATAKVSPTLYGLMTEEINYSYEGGLYGELIRNRAFKDDPKEPAHWSLVQIGGAQGAMALDDSQPMNQALPMSLRIDATTVSGAQRVGAANDGYWGIPVKPDTTYRASFYAKGAAGFSGPLLVSMESPDGATVYALGEVTGIGADWKQYTATLKTGTVTPTAAARFVISTSSPGKFWLNQVSLFPPTYNDRPNGNRIDIMQLLVDMKPTFLRFPGGNYLEGGTMQDYFNWKETIGDLAQRPGHKSPWGYHSSDGFGLLEFLEWDEDFHGQPVLAVFAGYALNHDHVAAGPALEPYVQDALDEIEYVTGDTSTKWGAERAKDGHPDPFPLNYIEVGNEDTFDRSGSYDGRYAQFYDAIKKKYPQLQIIATTKVTSRKPDLIDDHYYRNAGQMEGDANHYDKYDRNGPKIFVGEWATREGDPTTNLNAALGDAAWLTGLERNSDLVRISCYAPLFVNVNPGGMQWKSDLIGYDTLTSYGSPSYYVQKMFNTHLGDVVVPISAQSIPSLTWQPPMGKKDKQPPAPKQLPGLYYVATRDSAKGTIFLKVVNIQSASQPVKIEIKGVTTVSTDGETTVLTSASPKDTNSIAEPTKIVPVTAPASGLGSSFTQTFAPYSVTVLKLETQ